MAYIRECRDGRQPLGALHSGAAAIAFYGESQRRLFGRRVLQHRAAPYFQTERELMEINRLRAAQERNRNRLQSAVDPRRASWHRWSRLVRLHNALAVRIIGLSRAEA